MRVFERDGLPTVTISKISYDGTNTKATFSETTKETEVSSAYKPHADLLDSYKALTELMENKLRLPKRSTFYKLACTGVSFVSTKDYAGYKLKATMKFRALNCESNVNAFLFIPYPGYWEAEDKYGKLVHDPDDEPENLTDDEIEIIENAFSEAYSYFYEGKRAPDDQMDLFDQTDDEAQEGLADAVDDAVEQLAEDLKEAGLIEMSVGGEVVYRRDEPEETKTVEDDLDDEGDIDDEEEEEE